MKAKKIISVLLFVSIFFVGLFAMSACGDDLPDNSGGVEITLTVLGLDNTNLYEKKHSTTKSSLFEALSEFEGLQIMATYNYLGAYINAVSVGTVEENEYGSYFSETLRLEGSLTAGTYIAVYHDIDKDTLKDLSPYSLDLSYSGKTYFYSGVSVNMLPLYDGAAYALKLTKY